MRPRSPWLFLSLFAGLALAIAVAGVVLSRRERAVRLDRERAPLFQFEQTLKKEIERLDALYEQHLLTVARGSFPEEPRAVRDACGWLIGLRQVSVLRRPRASEMSGDFHAPINATPGVRLPEPIFAENKEIGLTRPRIKLSAAVLLQGPETHGWILDPGGALLFWARRDATQAVVLLLDAPLLQVAVSRWLETWAGREFETVRAAGGPDALLAPDNQRVLAVGAVPEPPHLLLPLRTHLGTWFLASWDRSEMRESHHLPTLLGAAAVALVVALLGVLTFFQQRRTVRLALQRVSFVNSVSHELRTPLTNMLLNLDLLTDHTDAGGAPRLALVREETARLGRLIENVLTFSRHEQGRLALRASACQPAVVLAAVLEQFRVAFARRAITVHQELAAGTAALDADALAQIVANLLSNVEKYAPGSEVLLACVWEAETLRVRVADTGPGIPASAVERVFRPFERLDARLTEGVTGTGLGLAIARDLAAGMGGTLRLVPSPCGATFELQLPARQIGEPHLNLA